MKNRVEFAPHPGQSLYNEYVDAWKCLDETDQALHKIAETETYLNYRMAQKYGIQVYNIMNDPIINK